MPPAITNNVPPAIPKPDPKKNMKSESSQHSEKAAINVNALVDEYVSFINLMGEAVGKSQKSTKGVEVEWFTGVFYIYKRFLRERKSMEACLEKGENKLSRPGRTIDQAAF